MPVASDIDSPRSLVEFLLAGLPWAALLVDPSSRICAANDTAHVLLRQPPAALLQRRLDSYTTTASTPALHEVLRIAQQESYAARALWFGDDEHEQRLACLVQTLDLSLTEGVAEPLLVVVLRDGSDHEAKLTSWLGAATAACFGASDPGSFYRQLEQACAALHLSAYVVLYTGRPGHEVWQHLSIDPEIQATVERHLGMSVLQLLGQHFAAFETRTEPQAVPIMELCRVGDGAGEQEHIRRAILKLIWWQVGIAVPLVAHGRSLGLLFVTGAGLRAGDVALLQPFGQLLGMALDRLMLQSDIDADRLASARLLRSNQAITEVTKLNDVLRVVCEQSLLLSGGTTAVLLMPDPDGQHLRCVMALGPYSDLLLGHSSSIQQSVVGQVFREQRPRLINDLQREAQINTTLRRLIPFHSGIFLPLQIQNRAVGVLTVGHHELNFFNSQQLQLLAQFGINATIAIENAQLHESVRRSEERYRTLFQNALEIVLTLDLEGHVIAGNRTALQFFGVSPAELRGGALNLYDLLTPETARWMREMQTQTLLGQPPLPVEIEVRRPDGTQAVVEVTLQSLHEHGQPTGVYIIGRDMTERRRQQRALTHQVAQLTALHKLSVALNASLERDAILQRAVEAIAHANQYECVGIYLPYPCEQKLSLVAMTGVDAVTRTKIKHSLPGSMTWQTWKTAQVRTATTADLAPRLQGIFGPLGIYTHIFLPLISTNRALGVLVIGRSGSEPFGSSDFQVLQTMAAQIAQSLENSKLYAEVERSAARYRDLYENANDFIGTLSIDGRILSLNRAALEFFGCSAESLPRLMLHDLLAPGGDRTVAQTLELLQQNNMPANGIELRVIRHDGVIAIVEIRSRLVLDGDEPTAIHFIARDTTERHQLEAQVRQGEKLAALGQLVAGAAHELNNPLAVVLGTTQLLLRDATIGRFGEDVRNIEAAAQRAKHIVSQMLTFARAQDDVRGSVDVALLVERVVQGIRGRLEYEGIQIRVEIPPTIPAIWGDAYQLEQVLDNLLHNAVQALSERQHGPREVTIAASATERSIRISVADNGPGIAPQVLPRIFDPFFTTKEVGHGTGLGLSLVYGIVDKHGGTIQAESVLGLGATFVVELPANQDTTPRSAPTVVVGATNSTILVVEDEPDVRAVVERALTQHGYLVDAVDSAEAALARANNQRYDLVITDLRMPGLSGKELFEQLHPLQPRLNWVFITGDTLSPGNEALLKRNGIPFLAKPFTLEELWDAVATSILSAQERH